MFDVAATKERRLVLRLAVAIATQQVFATVVLSATLSFTDATMTQLQQLVRCVFLISFYTSSDAFEPTVRDWLHMRYLRGVWLLKQSCSMAQ